MKRIKIAALCVAMAMSSFLAAPVASAAPNPKQAQTSWISQIPVNIIVEQKATLSDGRTVTLYYQKTGDICDVYSNDNLKGYTVNDLIGLREYGVVDAVYITGGNSYDFHRTADGEAHISDNVREKFAKYSSNPLPSPILVFRRIN